MPPWTPTLRAGLAGAPRDLVEHRPGRLWRLADAEGALWLKRPASARAAAAEAGVLALGLPFTPRLRAFDGRALLMEHLPGEDVEALDLPPAEARAAHRAMGAALAALHAAVPPPADPLPLSEALSLRLEAAARRLEGQRAPLAALREALARAPLDAQPRALCHRDLHPRNWRWDGRAPGLLDFEHARGDHPAQDLVKLATEVWPARPDLRAAFLDGLGWAPDPLTLRALVGLHGLATWAWGAAHRQPAFVRLGQDILKLNFD